ncbi:serine/threonine-protein kinase pim-2 [Etheostoma spectabile]|uniref:serine/threonine-protein kinase pim-2 n=1 Tax=Etheostoma spectabile TaxID=54343 RepID=UPI0013AF343E|nr:serine/threonine-protein kinase pim-2-like [Etheostoma spectabile]
MAHNSTQKFKTLHAPASREDQANDSNAGKLSYGTGKDVKDWRGKRKAGADQGLRADGVPYTSCSHSVTAGGASVRESKWKTDTNDDCPKKKRRGSNDTNINGPSTGFITGSRVTQDDTDSSSDTSTNGPRTGFITGSRVTQDDTDSSSDTSTNGPRTGFITGSRVTPDDTDSPSKMHNSDFSLSSSSCSSSDEDIIHDIPFSVKTSRAEFEATYIEIYQIAKGGFGAVYAGYRKEDAVSVAIKHIPKGKVYYSKVIKNGKVFKVIEEVALMVKAAGGAESAGSSAAISLLDCYLLEEDLVLIMERPVPSMDLHQYRKAKRGFLQEDEAKSILRQMVDAAVEMHTNGVFHRDIKLENILIEVGSHVPRARVIDFGCGCPVIKGYYYRYSGTFSKAPPEWFIFKRYKAGPTTVWQLGALLYDLLDHDHSFKTRIYLERGIKINCNLSLDCQEFLQTCLAINPHRRPSLEQLQLHPWLR